MLTVKQDEHRLQTAKGNLIWYDKSVKKEKLKVSAHNLHHPQKLVSKFYER